VILPHPISNQEHILLAQYIADSLKSEPDTHLYLVTVFTVLATIFNQLPYSHTVRHHTLKQSLLKRSRHSLSTQEKQINTELLRG